MPSRDEWQRHDPPPENLIVQRPALRWSVLLAIPFLAASLLFAMLVVGAALGTVLLTVFLFSSLILLFIIVGVAFLSLWRHFRAQR